MSSFFISDKSVSLLLFSCSRNFAFQKKKKIQKSVSTLYHHFCYMGLDFFNCFRWGKAVDNQHVLMILFSKFSLSGCLFYSFTWFHKLEACQGLEPPRYLVFTKYPYETVCWVNCRQELCRKQEALQRWGILLHFIVCKLLSLQH